MSAILEVKEVFDLSGVPEASGRADADQLAVQVEAGESRRPALALRASRIVPRSSLLRSSGLTGDHRTGWRPGGGRHGRAGRGGRPRASAPRAPWRSSEGGRLCLAVRVLDEQGELELVGRLPPKAAQGDVVGQRSGVDVDDAVVVAVGQAKQELVLHLGGDEVVEEAAVPGDHRRSRRPPSRTRRRTAAGSSEAEPAMSRCPPPTTSQVQPHGVTALVGGRARSSAGDPTAASPRARRS